MNNKNFVEKIAKYIASNYCTVREAAQVFGMSHSYLHKLMRVDLKDYNPELYVKVVKVFEYNKSVALERATEASRHKNNRL